MPSIYFLHFISLRRSIFEYKIIFLKNIMKKLDFDLVKEILKTLSYNTELERLYSPTAEFPNRKYKVDDVIRDIVIYVTKGCSLNYTKFETSKDAVYYHLSRFKKHKIFQKTFERLLKYHKVFRDSKFLISDTSFINNAHGTEKLGRNKFNKNKNAFKLSILTDQTGLPIDVLLEPGNVSDIVILKKHVLKRKNELGKKKILADAGYCSNQLRDDIRSAGGIPIIAYNNRNTKKAAKRNLTPDEADIYKKRIKVEHSFASIKQCRNIQPVFMKTYDSYLNLLYCGLLHVIHKPEKKQ